VALILFTAENAESAQVYKLFVSAFSVFSAVNSMESSVKIVLTCPGICDLLFVIYDCGLLWTVAGFIDDKS